MSTRAYNITDANDKNVGIHCGTNTTSADICHIRCDNNNDRSLIPIHCGHAGKCVLNCNKKRCMKESTINATLSQSLEIRATNFECLAKASVYLPKDGNATIIVDTEGVEKMNAIAKQAKFYSQSTHNIDFTCNDPLFSEASTDECKQIEIYAQDADSLSVTFNGAEAQTAIIYCPFNSIYEPSCVINASNVFKLSDTSMIYTGNGSMPTDLLFYGGGSSSDYGSGGTRVKVTCSEGISSINETSKSFENAGSCWKIPTSAPTTSMPSTSPITPTTAAPTTAPVTTDAPTTAPVTTDTPTTAPVTTDAPSTSPAAVTTNAPDITTNAPVITTSTSFISSATDLAATTTATDIASTSIVTDAASTSTDTSDTDAPTTTTTTTMSSITSTVVSETNSTDIIDGEVEVLSTLSFSVDSDESTVTKSGADNMTIYILIGASVFVFILLSIAAFLFRRRRTNKANASNHSLDEHMSDNWLAGAGGNQLFRSQSMANANGANNNNSVPQPQPRQRPVTYTQAAALPVIPPLPPAPVAYNVPQVSSVPMTSALHNNDAAAPASYPNAGYNAGYNANAYAMDGDYDDTTMNIDTNTNTNNEYYDGEIPDETVMPPMIAVSNDQIVVKDTLTSIIQQHKEEKGSETEDDYDDEAAEEHNLNRSPQEDEDEDSSDDEDDSYDMFTPLPNDEDEEENVIEDSDDDEYYKD